MDNQRLRRKQSFQSSNNPLPPPHNNPCLHIRHNLLSNPHIRRPLVPLPLILKLILRNNPAHNRLDRNRREEPTRACLASESEMHIVRADTDETVRFDLGRRGPAEAGEGGWLGDDVGVAREGARCEANVGAAGKD